MKKFEFGPLEGEWHYNPENDGPHVLIADTQAVIIVVALIFAVGFMTCVGMDAVFPPPTKTHYIVLPDSCVVSPPTEA